MITQIDSMEFKEQHHCYDDNGTGIDFYGYMNAEGILTDDLYNSVKHAIWDMRLIGVSQPIKSHRINTNGIVLQMTRNIHWYLVNYIWKKN